MNTKTKNIFLAIAISLLAPTLFSCDFFNETEELKPGRRDYTWTVDTVKVFSTYLMKMWASSPTDVWAVGHGGDLSDDIWHYDGNKWSTDGISRLINPWCIYGFSENDVWIGGQDGMIWHYDGKIWEKSLFYKEETNYIFYDIIFMDIWGENPDDIYAVGLADSSNVRISIMMHYNGTNWSRVNVEIPNGTPMKIRKGDNSSNYYIWNYIRNSGQDSTKFFQFDGKYFSEIYSDINLAQTLTLIDDEVLFNFDKGAYAYNNSTFVQIAKNPLPNSWDAIYGRNKKDLIWAMSDGLTHYNGTNFEYILNFENKSLSDGIVFEKEVFFVANDFYNNNANNLIYHGVLK